MARSWVALLVSLALVMAGCSPGVPGMTGGTVAGPGESGTRAGPGPAAGDGAEPAAPPAVSPFTRAGRSGEVLPRCAGWLWEARKLETGDTTFSVAVVVSRGQPLYPALVCWLEDGVSLPAPSVRTLQSDGLVLASTLAEDHRRQGNRHLWVFATEAPVLAGQFYLHFRFGDQPLLNVPFEVSP